jgi:hypothetical protein
MKTDVAVLIGALRTERDSLTRAIVALEAISDSGAPKSNVVPRPRLTDLQKREEYGVMQSTVSMGWTTWAREFGIEPKRTSLFIPKARTDEYATV